MYGVSRLGCTGGSTGPLGTSAHWAKVFLLAA